MRVVSRLCLVTSASLILLSPAAAQELTEDQAVVRFMEQSPDVRALRRRVAEQAQRNRVRTLLANPTVWYTQENAAGVQDDFLQIRQPIPISGRRGFFDKANREATASVEATVEHQIHELQTAVRRVFALLLSTQRREQALREALREIDDTVRVLVAREREGEGSHFDRLRGERERQELQATLAGETINRTRTQSNLAGRLGMAGSAETLVAIGAPDTESPLPPVTRLIAQALASRADLRAGSSRLTSVDAEQQAGRRLKFPEPSFTGGMKRTRVRGVGGTGYTFGVELAIPLSNRGQADVALAVATSVRLRADQDALRLRIERQVRTAYRVTTLTRQQADTYIEGAGMSGEELARIARVAYEEGEQGILELVDAHRVALSARLRGIDLMADARYAEIELTRVVGNEVLQ